MPDTQQDIQSALNSVMEMIYKDIKDYVECKGFPAITKYEIAEMALETIVATANVVATVLLSEKGKSIVDAAIESLEYPIH